MTRTRAPDSAFRAPPSTSADLTWQSFTLLRTSDGGTRITVEEARDLLPLLRRLLRVVEGVLAAEEAMATGPLSPDRLT